MDKSDIKDCIKHAIETADDRKKESCFGKITYCCMRCDNNYPNRQDFSHHRCNILKRKWYKCEKCEKTLSSYHSLWRHKKTCKNDLKRKRNDDDEQVPVKIKANNIPSNDKTLRWNGSCWKTENESLRYQLNLGRDLTSILERRALNENEFNDMQKESINMYKALYQTQS